MPILFQRSAALACVLLFATPVARGQSWEAKLSPFVPGSFAEPRPLRARDNFGWSGFAAATVDFRLEKLSNDRFQLEAHGGTVGLARTLWKFDLRHTALSDAKTLRPVSVQEDQKLRAKEVATALTYSPTGVSSAREERSDGAVKSKTRHFDFPNILSINSALLFLRTQPLTDGASYRVAVYPATSAYLCTVTVIGRERLAVASGKQEAIKLDVQLSKIGENRELTPHKKFRKATVWLSNDADRLVLRVEAQVFIGQVFAELQSVQFDNPIP